MPSAGPSRILSLIVVVTSLSVTGCTTTRTTSAPPPSGPTPITTTPVDRADRHCVPTTDRMRLTSRLAFENDVFLPPGSLAPTTSAARARTTLISDPSASILPHPGRAQEIFAIYRNFKGRRPVWFLLEQNVPSSGSLSNAIVKHDIVDILDDRTDKLLGIIDARPNGCANT